MGYYARMDKTTAILLALTALAIDTALLRESLAEVATKPPESRSHHR